MRIRGGARAHRPEPHPDDWFVLALPEFVVPFFAAAACARPLNPWLLPDLSA
ncbi:MAG: hypothetical protein HYV07_07655 [Deltaproteobacteria bacterium]|nr:hypothetical protein [Deltaproteobacteria bacterium]